MVNFLDSKKRKLFEDEFQKLKHDIDTEEVVADEEFIHIKENKDSDIVNGVNINELADINPDSDIAVTEKKTKDGKFKQ